MELRVLGSDGSYPRANGACSGFLVTQGEERLLLDLGCGVLPRLMALADPARLTAVLLTHWHNDHVSDMLALRYCLQLRAARLDVYAPPEPHPLKDYLTGAEFNFLDVSLPRAVGGFSLEALKVPHPEPAYALKVSRGGRTVVYTGDAAERGGLEGFCRGADALVCDATFTLAQWKPGMPHFSAAQAAGLARDAGAGRLLLTHFQPGSDGETLVKEARAVFPASEYAAPGLTLRL